MTRYLSGLCVAGLGLCAGGWLVVAAVAFGGKSAGLAGRVNLLTGVGLIALCCLSMVCWSFAWRQRMRVDGVLADRRLAVSRREARRDRRVLGRDVRRAGKVAGRSARGARRAARRSARAGGGGVLSGGALGEGGVLSAGAGLGSGSPAGQPGNVAVSYGTSANGVNGRRNGNGIGANRSGGTSVNGDGANGSAGAGLNGSAGDAAELIGQLREMLVPLLAATGSQPGVGATTGSQPAMGATAGNQPTLGGATGSQLAVGATTGSQPALGEQAGAGGLPRRTPSASSFRPRSASIPAQVPRAQAPQVRVPQARMPQRPPHPTAMRQVIVPGVDNVAVGGAVDGEETWW
jgi:hypothetical protein